MLKSLFQTKLDFSGIQPFFGRTWLEAPSAKSSTHGMIKNTRSIIIKKPNITDAAVSLHCEFKAHGTLSTQAKRMIWIAGLYTTNRLSVPAGWLGVGHRLNFVVRRF